jgi:hypothetical protein
MIVISRNAVTLTTRKYTFLFFLSLVSANTYFIDDINGLDSNVGTSAGSAWQTLTRVNATVFSAGDSIFFKANGIWVGQLFPKGSGSADMPIVIGQYGTGLRPMIDGGGMSNPVVYLYNQEYWEISDLEITNQSDTEGDRVGVRVEAENYGTVNYIHLENLYIHDVKGIVGHSPAAKRTGGINFRVLGENPSTRFNDLLIENCELVHLDGSGISNEANTSDYPGTTAWHARKYTNYRIRNNSINDISKNAIIMRMADSSCVVEYNLCWDTAYRAGTGNTIFSRSCLGTVFQFNEGYLNRATNYDGCLYDADLASPECVFQYSYSHDNNHGLFWTCTYPQDSNVICRYNISQNDLGNIFTVNYPNTSVYIYNNTVYIDSATSPTIISERNNGGSGNRTYYFYNNIIYNLSSNSSYQFTSGYNRTFENNCFYGQTAANEPFDPNKITSDPNLVNPGSGGIGILTLDGYQLTSTSPCINTGRYIENNGGRDFFGNTLYNGNPDIGAHEYSTTASTDFQGYEDTSIPAEYKLVQVYPNPFNPATTISYELTTAASIHLAIFNVLGEEVQILVNEPQNAGLYKLQWDTGNYPGYSAGTYLIRLRARDGNQRRHDQALVTLVK